MTRLAPLLALLLAWASSARADLATDALLLARICVSEAGWECFETGDGYAIHEVLLRGAERHAMRYETFARSYSPRATGMAPSRLRPWVAGLRADGGEPYSWPRVTTRPIPGGLVRVEPHPPWVSYRARWLAVLDRAREVVSWRLDDVDEWSICEGEVHDWGGEVDEARAHRIGLVPVGCGETANTFYCRPSDPDCVEVDRD